MNICFTVSFLKMTLPTRVACCMWTLIWSVTPLRRTTSIDGSIDAAFRQLYFEQIQFCLIYNDDFLKCVLFVNDKGSRILPKVYHVGKKKHLADSMFN